MGLFKAAEGAADSTAGAADSIGEAAVSLGRLADNMSEFLAMLKEWAPRLFAALEKTAEEVALVAHQTHESGETLNDWLPFILPPIAILLMLMVWKMRRKLVAMAKGSIGGLGGLIGSILPARAAKKKARDRGKKAS